MSLLCEFTSDDEEKTKAIAEGLSSCLQVGDVIALVGELGAGKTVFSRALIQALSVEDSDVGSPTFTLVQTYPVSLGDAERVTLYHYDLYRVDDVSELRELALDEAFEDGVSIIEWPQIAEDMLPDETLIVSLVQDDNSQQRKISFSGDEEAWQDKLISLSDYGVEYF